MSSVKVADFHSLDQLLELGSSVTQPPKQAFLLNPRVYVAHISKWLKMTKYTDNELHLLICTRSNQDFWICINLRSVMKLCLEVSQQVNSLCWDWSNGLFIVCAGGPVATRQCNWKVFGWHNCISAQGEFWCIWQTLQWQCTGTLLTCVVNHRVWTIFLLCLCHFTVLC